MFFLVIISFDSPHQPLKYIGLYPHFSDEGSPFVQLYITSYKMLIINFKIMKNIKKYNLQQF